MKTQSYSCKISHEKIDQLTVLLQACVDDGASVGYTDSVAQLGEIRDYWNRINDSISANNFKLITIEVDNHIVAVVGLERCSKPNGKHRGEVCKLLVSPSYRRRGLARHLMLKIEEIAWDTGLTLLTLDTVSNGITVDFYQSLGWHISGKIPQFARSVSGELESTTVMFKLKSC